MKKCSCCGKINSVPDNARADIQDDVLVAWVWECSCGSTLYFYRLEKELLMAMVRGEI